MHWIDWVLVAIPLFTVIFIGMKSQKYVHGVADFLAAGRVGGRYVVSVASGEAATGLISAVAIMEMYYNCGFAVSFWSSLSGVIGLFMGLTGFCTYRFRETKALTMGQFFEIRYNRAFRISASVVQSISGIINYAIFPAVGARFLVYFLDLPVYVNFLGLQVPSFMICMACFLGFALLIVMLGGQVTIMVTDCVQGLLSYPMYAVIVGYLFYRFSWTNEMGPAIAARAPGESFLNPYDVENLRDFNLFYVFAGIFGSIIGRMSWGGTMGYNSAARTPHEAKMGGLLGTWRGGFGSMIYILLAVAAFTYMNHADFAKEAREVRTYLAEKTIEDVARDSRLDPYRKQLQEQYKNIPERTKFSSSYATPAEYKAENADPYMALTADVLKDVPGGKKTAQTFNTIYNQMSVSIAIRDMLPIGVTGIFCAMMIFLMVSTDTTYMHSWGSIVVQDFILPLRKKAFTPEQQIRALRLSIAGVCLFAFCFSYWFAQIDFILMFFAITGAIWSGAAIVITLGLYWSRGTTAGAFTSLVSGAVIAVSGIILQQTWVEHVYPFLDAMGWAPGLGAFLEAVSSPFNPYIQWTMTPNKFPINSMEISFLVNLTTVILYVTVSLLTCKEPFNMERMLHRGIYSESGEVKDKTKFSLKSFITEKMVGIDSNYTRGDKILAWSVFGYSFVYGFGLCFFAVVVWNAVSPWPAEWWLHYFFIKNFAVAFVIAVVSTFWFSICGTIDLKKMFNLLASREETDVLDDGRVEGHMSAADVKRFKAIEEAQNK